MNSEQLTQTHDRSYLFTSESVSAGHPDKMADQISDRVLDEFLARDEDAKVACETVLADQFVLVAGEFRTKDQKTFEAVRDLAEGIQPAVRPYPPGRGTRGWPHRSG